MSSSDRCVAYYARLPHDHLLGDQPPWGIHDSFHCTVFGPVIRITEARPYSVLSSVIRLQLTYRKVGRQEVLVQDHIPYVTRGRS